jgi:predicted ATPase
VAEPVLLVLEDLHWADVASLRVLRMLVDTVASGRLLVLATWRSRPEPTVRWRTWRSRWPVGTRSVSS